MSLPYKSQHIYWDPQKELIVDKPQGKNCGSNILVFDSILELKVFQQLKNFLEYKKNGQYSITRQYPIVLKPRTANYPESKWVIDFIVHEDTNPKVLLEVKGAWIRNKSLKGLADLQQKLQLLEYFNNELWHKFVLVTDRVELFNEKKLKVPVLSLTTLDSHLGCFLQP